MIGIAAPAEVEPRCRHFGACGGCQLQHLSQATQLAVKQAHLEQLLLRAGVPLPPGGITVHAAEPWFYRNRIRLRIHDGQLGYSRAESHSFLAISECPIAAPLLWRAARTLLRLAREGRAGWTAASTELELVTTTDEDSLQMLLHVDATVATLDRDAPASFRNLCAALQAELPELAGGGLLVQGGLRAGSKRVQERERVEVARWGKPALTYRVSGMEYQVSRGAFFQVNRLLTERMVDLVTGGRHGALAFDLFAGAGLFSVALANTFARVIAVEVGEPAATDLASALRRAGPHHCAEQRTVSDFLRAARKVPGSAPDLVVLDPPRAGIGVPAARDLAALRAGELVYVSCDPETFARDARALVDSRYAVAELHLLDLFSQTTHMETIAVFRPA